MSASLEEIERALSRARQAPAKAIPVFEKPVPKQNFDEEREARRARSIAAAAERVAKREAERLRRDFERRGVKP
jgi:hypothetical protein